MKNRAGVLITGVTGFIGSAIARDLTRREGYFIRGLVRSSSQEIPASLEKVVADLNESTDWRLSLQNIDVVVHCAARVHVMKESALDPLSEFRKVNVEGTLNLARQAAKSGVRRFIFLSSIKVNGEATLLNKRFRPDDNPAPEDPYAISKHEAEIGLFKIAEKTGMEVVVIRPPLVYGPGVKGNFASMVKWLKRGVPLPLGSIYNKRSLIALENLVSFVGLCCDQKKSAKAANQVFLVSDGEDESTSGLLAKVAKAYGKKARLLPVPQNLIKFAAGLLGKKDAANRLLGSLQVDSSKLSELLDWCPAVTMDEQLKEMAKYDASV